MIAPMKRAFVVVLESQKRMALVEMRKLGALHLEPMAGSGQSYDSLVAVRGTLYDAIGLLSEFKATQDKTTISVDTAIETATAIKKLDASIRSLMEESAVLAREIERVRPWGDFDPALVAQLAEAGLSLRLVEIPSKKVANLPAELGYTKLDEAKGSAKLAVYADATAPLPSDCAEFRVPEKGLSLLETELDARKEAIVAVKADLAAYATQAGPLRSALKSLEQALAFEEARSGMATTDEGVAWLAAWVPQADVARLEQVAAAHGWALALDDPLDEEQPPTKVENPPLVRMIEPIFAFLGTVPNYREYDISALFLFFFTFFFAMIFGDAGYGTLLLLASLFAFFKAKGSGKGVPDMLKLMLVLSGATLVWGALTMTWFGVPVDMVPGFLQKLALPWISNANPESGDNIKVLCFSIGLVQLSIAHIKNIQRDFPSFKLLGQLGQLLMVGGIFFLVLNLVISSTKYPMPVWSLYLVAAGFTLNFVFANWEDGKPFGKALVGSILSSFANIVSVFLGVVNVFADIVSYIRLWAVGLAGVAISQAVNNMAGPMLGHFILFVGGVALLVFGHGLNIIMSVLSVIVHGVRLNVLEFSGHLGMEWSGYAYEPFRETVPAERAEMERSLS
ncbi:MAG: hypothetical protein JXM71_03355 [Spirochaetales bacterium]|nr:hypothetical protein [Spirochaetales bacterium]